MCDLFGSWVVAPKTVKKKKTYRFKNQGKKEEKMNKEVTRPRVHKGDTTIFICPTDKGW